MFRIVSNLPRMFRLYKYTLPNVRTTNNDRDDAITAIPVVELPKTSFRSFRAVGRQKTTEEPLP